MNILSGWLPGALPPKKFGTIAFILFLAFWTAPVFEVRLGLLGLFLFFLIRFAPQQVEWNKNFVVFPLLMFFALSYLFVPYGMGKPNPYVWMIFLVVTYLVYGYVVAKTTVSFRLSFDSRQMSVVFLTIFLVMFLLDFVQLKSAISHHTDTDYHLFVTKRMVDSYWYFRRLFFLFLILVFFFPTRPMLLVFIFILFGWLAFATADPYFTHMGIIYRYPQIFYLLNLIFSIPLQNGIIYQEGMFRILPFISVVGMGVVAASRTEKTGLIEKILIGLAVATIPNLFKHATLLYIELPIIFLIMVAVLYYRPFQEGQKNLTISLSLFSISLAAFFKETSLVAAVAFMGALTFELWRVRNALPVKLKIWAQGLILIMVPVFVYFLFRTGNSIGADFNHLLAEKYYLTTFKSAWDIHGIFLLFAISGAVYLSLNKQTSRILPGLFLLFGYLLSLLTMPYEFWVGHDRYQLYYLPALIAFFIFSLNILRQKARGKMMVYGITGTVLLSNVAFSPLNLDGTRRMDWSECRLRVPCTDYENPYQEFYSWLEQQQPIKNIGFVGRTYGYLDMFYFHKNHIDLSAVTQYKSIIGEVPPSFWENPTDVLVLHRNHHANYPNPKVEIPPEYKLVKTFRKEMIELFVYRYAKPIPSE